MKLTIASKVTILRICLIPLFILSYYFFDGRADSSSPR